MGLGPPKGLIIRVGIHCSDEKEKKKFPNGIMVTSHNFVNLPKVIPKYFMFFDTIAHGLSGGCLPLANC